MYVLTLWPEWAWATFVLFKGVENRTWLPFIEPGDDLLIHAGRSIGGKPGRSAAIRGLSRVAEVARTAGWTVTRSRDLMVWTFKKAGNVHQVTWHPAAATGDVELITSGAIVGAVRFDGVLESDSPWADKGEGVHHWHWSNRRRFGRPYAAKGRQGLWRLPEIRERSISMELDLLADFAGRAGRFEVWLHDIVDRHSDPPTVWSGRKSGDSADLAHAHRLACSALHEVGGRPVNLARILKDGQHVRTLVHGDGQVQEVADELRVLERSA